MSESDSPPVKTLKGQAAPRAYAEPFHRKLGYPVRDTPEVPPDAEVRYRLRFMWEEFRETMQAAFDGNSFVQLQLDACQNAIHAVISQPINVNLPEFIDGLADQDYVNEGTRLYFGVDGDAIMKVVHRANMAKEYDPKVEKAVKPPMWKAPDIAGALVRQGWIAK